MQMYRPTNVLLSNAGLINNLVVCGFASELAHVDSPYPSNASILVGKRTNRNAMMALMMTVPWTWRTIAHWSAEWLRYTQLNDIAA